MKLYMTYIHSSASFIIMCGLHSSHTNCCFLDACSWLLHTLLSLLRMLLLRISTRLTPLPPSPSQWVSRTPASALILITTQHNIHFIFFFFTLYFICLLSVSLTTMKELAHGSIPSSWDSSLAHKKVLSKYLSNEWRKQQENLDSALSKGSMCIQLTPFLLQGVAEWFLQSRLHKSNSSIYPSIFVGPLQQKRDHWVQGIQRCLSPQGLKLVGEVRQVHK